MSSRVCVNACSGNCSSSSSSSSSPPPLSPPAPDTCENCETQFTVTAGGYTSRNGLRPNASLKLERIRGEGNKHDNRYERELGFSLTVEPFSRGTALQAGLSATFFDSNRQWGLGFELSGGASNIWREATPFIGVDISVRLQDFSLIIGGRRFIDSRNGVPSAAIIDQVNFGAGYTFHLL